MIINNEQRWIFVSNPKAGTHTMYKILGEMYGLSYHRAKWLEKYFDPKGKCQQYGMSGSNTHSNVIPAARASGFYKFSVVRNPYDKAVSAWWHLLKTDKELTPQRRQFRQKMFKAIGGEDFKSFAEWLPNRHRVIEKKSAMMFNSQFDWMGHIKFDKILKLENLSTEIKTIPFLKDAPVTQEYSFSNERNNQYYTTEIKELIYGAYKEDFEVYGYEK
jgi:hypothetical protein